MVGKFKENEGFQQTRGVIRLMQIVVSNLWKSGKAAGIDVIHPYDLKSYFSASLRDCYQTVKVLPPPDEIQVEQEKTTLVIVRPGGQANQLPISTDWQAWWSQQPYKNRVLFLTDSRDTFQKVLDSARQTRALDSIKDDLKSESAPADDPQWRALDILRDRVGLQFTAALKEAFDQIVYPSINSALRSTGIDLAFAGNSSGEATIRHTLESAQKFTARIDEDSFLTRAEARLLSYRSSYQIILPSRQNQPTPSHSDHHLQKHQTPTYLSLTDARKTISSPV